LNVNFPENNRPEKIAIFSGLYIMLCRRQIPPHFTGVSANYTKLVKRSISE
jgi:hypothetical protein